MWTIAADVLAEAAKLRVPVVELSREASARLHRDLASKYARSARHWPLWEESDDPAIQDASAWRWIADFVKSESVTLVWDPSEEPIALRFESGDALVTVLEEMYGTEFYVTDERTSYAFCFNHHDYLIAFGNAGAWLCSRIDAG